jgi:hypothetical protein
MVGACLAFRNAGEYIQEWLDFHLLAGVDYFLLYNNDSTDNFGPIIEPYSKKGVAQLIDWPGYKQQNAIYDHALKVAKSLGISWLAFIDDDEFLFDSQGASLKEALCEYEPYGGVAVAWKIFGSSNKIHRDPGLVTERFTKRAPLPDHHHKCVVRPELTKRCVSAGHYFECVSPLVDQKKEAVSSAMTQVPFQGRIHLNHYVVKSIHEMIERRTARDIGTGDAQKLSLLQWLELDRNWNAVDDDLALRVWHRAKS